MKLAWIFLPFLFVAFGTGSVEASWLDKISFNKQSPLSNDKIISGLKEALQVGIDKTVAAAGKANGYYGNPAIRIPFPQNLSLLEKTLRKVGMGPKVDNFERSMNLAAEKAAPLAKDIFLKALLSMNFDDAKAILNGGETAATDYFKRKTSTELMAVFKPHIEKSMNEYQVSQQYNQLVQNYEKLPFASKPKLVKVDDYVGNKALDGLFYLLSQEERQIRTNPAARVTQLLQDVFGK